MITGPQSIQVVTKTSSIYVLTTILMTNETGKWMVLREEHRLRVFENRVLRRIFGPKRD
jgi:hypothetical protein